MEQINASEARQRVERWAEEGQELLARILPTILDECDRLQARAEAAEQNAGRLRSELGEVERELSDLRTVNDHLRREQAEIRTVFVKLADQASQLLQPLNEMLTKMES